MVTRQNFKSLRAQWTYALKKLFLVPANTFDNVRGDFPIGFFIWKTGKQDWGNLNLQADIYNHNGVSIETYSVICYDNKRTITDWYKEFYDNNASDYIGFIYRSKPTIQHNNLAYIFSTPPKIKGESYQITPRNLMQFAVYYSVRNVIKPTWVNDSEYYLYPKATWETDMDFQTDCLTYALFDNRISAADGPNHWIPFTETEVDAAESFTSHFMTKFIAGKYKPTETTNTLLGDNNSFILTSPLVFSEEAQEVFNAGRELWKYYHTHKTMPVITSTQASIISKSFLREEMKRAP